MAKNTCESNDPSQGKSVDGADTNPGAPSPDWHIVAPHQYAHPVLSKLHGRLGGEVMMFALLTIALAVVLGWLSLVDIRHLQLPDVGTVSLIAIGLALSAYSGGAPGLLTAAGGAAIGFASFRLISALYRRLRRRHGLGLGDAKLLAVSGAWLGPLYLAPTVLIGAILALGFVLLLRMTGRKISSETRVPFGPFLSASFFLLWCMHVAALL